MHSAVPRALRRTEQANSKGCFKAGISAAADVSTFYCVCSFSLSPPPPPLPPPLPRPFCMCVHCCYRNIHKRWVHVLMYSHSPSSLGIFACVLLCTYSMRQDMCGRVDRPSKPLWQMKVMLRRRDAWRKAGNKQSDLWRTLKHTSEGKEGGKRGEKSKWRRDKTE